MKIRINGEQRRLFDVSAGSAAERSRLTIIPSLKMKIFAVRWLQLRIHIIEIIVIVVMLSVLRSAIHNERSKDTKVEWTH